MSTTRKDNDFLNGVPELLLLRLLARQPMYGYELVQTIRLASGELGGATFQRSPIPAFPRMSATTCAVLASAVSGTPARLWTRTSKTGCAITTGIHAKRRSKGFVFIGSARACAQAKPTLRFCGAYLNHP